MPGHIKHHINIRYDYDNDDDDDALIFVLCNKLSTLLDWKFQDEKSLPLSAKMKSWQCYSKIVAL